MYVISCYVVLCQLHGEMHSKLKRSTARTCNCTYSSGYCMHNTNQFECFGHFKIKGSKVECLCFCFREVNTGRRRVFNLNLNLRSPSLHTAF